MARKRARFRRRGARKGGRTKSQKYVTLPRGGFRL